MFKQGIFLLSSLISAASVNAASSINNTSLPWGRVEFSAAEASANLAIFGSDLMLPVYGDQGHFVYGDVMGNYGTDGTYIISPGLGIPNSL